MSSNDTITQLLSTLQANNLSQTTVMGPEYEVRIAELSKDEMADLKKARTADDFAALIHEKIIQPAMQEYEDERQRKQVQMQTHIKKIQKQINRQSGNKRAEAKEKFDDSLKFTIDIAKRMQKVESRLRRNTKRLNRLRYADESSNSSDSGEDDGDKADKIDKLQKKRNELEAESKQLQARLFNHFDQTLGGMRAVSKADKKPLAIPRLNDKTTSDEIIDAIKTFMLHRAAEFYAILPWIHYISDSYDSSDGTYAKPPDKADEYAEVPTELREAYQQQAELLYREILTTLKQTVMARITTTFNYGLNKDKKAKCTAGDGPTAYFCLLAKYGKQDAHSMTDLEAEFIKAPKHFSFGSPAAKVHHLTKPLAEVLRLGIKLKANQTIIPIIDVLAERHNKFAVTLDKYYNGGSTPDDCAATLEEMFAKIVKVCANIERITGSEIWQTQTQVHMAESYRGNGKGKGRGKGNGKGKGKGKGNGKGKGKETAAVKANNKTYNRCQAKDCWGDAKQHKFCSECFMKGMNTGHILCYDGYDQPISRANRQQDKASTFGFSNKQMEGIAAVATHIANRQEQQIDANSITPFKRPAEDNKSDERRPVFQRLGTNDADQKKQRQVDAFFSKLAHYQC